MLIKKPIITEKTLNAYEKEKKVTFEVALNANKIEASKALKSMYGLEVKNISVVNRVGKYKLDRRTRRLYKTPDKKIMIFTLGDKDKLDIFEK